MALPSSYRAAMRSLRTALLSCVVAAIVLLGCHVAGAQQITWWAPNWGEARAKVLVKQFEAANPGITVRIESTVADGLQNRVLAALRSGSPPDLIDINNSWNIAFAQNGRLVDLSEFVRDEKIDLNDFLPATLTTAKVGDKVYGLPYRAETVALYFNKAQYRAAGLDPAHPPQTWSELVDVSKKLTVKGPNGQEQYGFGLVGGGEVANMVTRAVPFIWMDGGNLISDDGKTALINRPPAVEAIQAYTDFLVKYNVSPPSTLQNDGLALRRLFDAGTIAQYVSGQYDIPALQAEAPNLDYGVAVMPHPEGKPTVTLLGGWNFIVPQAATHHDATLKLLAFLAQPAQMGMYTDTFPARTSAFKLPRFQAPNLAAFKDALQYARPAPPIPAWVQIGQILYNNVQKVLLKSATPQQAMDAAAKQIQPLLSQ